MATNPWNTPHLNRDLLDMFSATAPAAARAPLFQDLPTGACNFIDLTPGANASKCGCRRFWASPTQRSPSQDPTVWCMCNHHACYHDEGPRSTQQQQPQLLPPNNNNNNNSHHHHHHNLQQRHQQSHDLADQEAAARALRESTSPLLDLHAPAIQSMGQKEEASVFLGSTPSQLSFLRRSLEGPAPAFPAFSNGAEAYLPTPSPPAPPPAPFPAHNNNQDQSVPDTLIWNDFVQSPPGNINSPLPPIPSQCLIHSQATSTTSSMRRKYNRPFAGKGLQTLNAQAPARQTFASLRARSTPPRPVSGFQQDAASAVEGAVFLGPPSEGPLQRPGSAATQIEPRAISEHCMREEVTSLRGLVDTHEQRLDRMEADCYSDCPDRHEQADLRMTDLEGRMEEVEKFNLVYAGALSRSHHRQDDAASSISTASGDSTASRRPRSASHWRDVDDRLQDLEARVTRLQSINPSIDHAWEIEVVFLPFALKRVWQSIHDFKDPILGASDDWTQLPETQGAPGRARSLSITDPFFSSTTATTMTPAVWATRQEPEHEWLLARAFSENSATDRRLRSRGLIQTISVRGPDARSVQTAMGCAFDAIFRDMQMHTRATHGGGHRMARYLGLQSPWVPLRKIHKDSRLRFLNPGEMVTPELWTVPFLTSVMMRAVRPRLFVTHPDAYLQDRQAFQAGWTWSKLKEAPSVCLDFTETQQVSSQADDLEHCWAWSEQLDSAPEDALMAKPPPLPRQQRVSRSPSVTNFPPLQRLSSSPSIASLTPLQRMPSSPSMAHLPSMHRASTLPAVANFSSSLQRLSSSSSVANLPSVQQHQQQHQGMSTPSPMSARNYAHARPNSSSPRDRRDSSPRRSTPALPSAAAAAYMPSPKSNPKRHITPSSFSRSGGQATRRTTPTGRQMAAQNGVVKRRSAQRPPPPHARFTPRPTASPSPMPPPSLPRDTGERHAQRHTTPHAYNTPQSNVHRHAFQLISPLIDEDVNMCSSDLDESFCDAKDNEEVEDEDGEATTEMAQHAQPRDQLSSCCPSSSFLLVRPDDEGWAGIRDDAPCDEVTDPTREALQQVLALDPDGKEPTNLDADSDGDADVDVDDHDQGVAPNIGIESKSDGDADAKSDVSDAPSEYTSKKGVLRGASQSLQNQDDADVDMIIDVDTDDASTQDFISDAQVRDR